MKTKDDAALLTNFANEMHKHTVVIPDLYHFMKQHVIITIYIWLWSFEYAYLLFVYYHKHVINI